MKKIFVVLLSIFLFANPKQIDADNGQSFVTIVNPVRISFYTRDIVTNLKTQYSLLSGYKMPASWLLTYDALTTQNVVNFIHSMDKSQEIGILLEVTPKLAKDAGVTYHETGSWHFANAVFLSGYTQEERKLLIDKLYEIFKLKFGYYPVSVGSWWSDSFSLNYIKEKYGVSANLTVSDQFSTDNYQVWGQPWEAPYYPSKYHTAVPASDLESKLDVVNFQWAPRDPVNGYKNSLYSTQDYFVLNKNLGTSYFEKLVKLYLDRGKNSFGQVTIGLESDLSPESYKGEFASQLEVVRNFRDKEGVQVVTMKDFSSWYKKSFPELSPPHLIEAQDFLGEQKKILWYESPFYRIGVLVDEDKKEKKIFDFRIYSKDMVDPYYFSPNRNINLSIYIPSIFDEVNYEKDVWILPFDSEISFEPKRISIKPKGTEIPEILKNHPSIEITRNKEKIFLSIGEKWIADRDGLTFRDLSTEAIHFFKQKKFLLYLISGRGWENFKKVTYFVPSGELEVLFKLSELSAGKVLVYDKECLQCEWHTIYKPAVFANLRSYVKKYGKHPIIYNSSVFDAKTREEAKNNLKRLGVRYIYVSKFESYIEKTPFSPGDLNIEKLYANANAEIWRLKE